MKQFNRRTGDLGEEKAVKFLKDKGYKIIERNFRTRFGEIDIIAEKDKVLAFFEVKTKTSDQFGEPWEMVNQHKLKQIKMMAEVYMAKKNFSGSCRIDVVGVYLTEGKIEHWENAGETIVT